jgi:hypothetical protein
MSFLRSIDGRGTHSTPKITALNARDRTRSMSVTLDDYVAAAREFIRREGGCVVSICQLLDELSDKFGDRFAVSLDTYKVLDLIETLWADPHVDQVPMDGSSFAWNEKGFDQVPFTGLKAMLLGRFQIPSATKQET